MAFGAAQLLPFVREGIERREATDADYENLIHLLAPSFPAARHAGGGNDPRAERQAADSRHFDMVYALLTLSD